MAKKIALFLCLLSMPLLGGSISGEYGITGFNPYSQKSYQGKAIVEENGDVCNVTWHISPASQVFTGTGIRKGDSLSVAFRNLSNDAEVGVYTYQIKDDTLTGKWIYIGRDKKGSETLKLLQ